MCSFDSDLGAAAEEAEEDKAAKTGGALGDDDESSGGDAESLQTSENYKLTWPMMEAMGSKFSHLRDSVTLIAAATDLTTPTTAESSDWDVVSSACWGALEFHRYGESFFSKVRSDQTADVMKKLQAECLFQQRWQYTREGHVFKGSWDELQLQCLVVGHGLRMTELVLCRSAAQESMRCSCRITGTRFICGAPRQDLCQHLSEKLGDEWAGSFLQLCDRLPQLSAQELGDVGGLFVVLKEKQMIEIPARYVFAEVPLTPASISSYWSVLRRGCSAGVLRDAGFSLSEMIELDLENHKQGNEDFLDRVNAQARALPTFVGWAIFRGSLAPDNSPDADESVTKAAAAEVRPPLLAISNQAFNDEPLCGSDMRADGEVHAANPDSVAWLVCFRKFGSPLVSPVLPDSCLDLDAGTSCFRCLPRSIAQHLDCDQAHVILACRFNRCGVA